MSLSVNISLYYKSCLISFQITILWVFEVYKTKRNKTFAKLGRIDVRELYPIYYNNKARKFTHAGEKEGSSKSSHWENHV